MDTSVVVALLTVEPKTVDVTRWYTELQETLVSSDWLLTEFSSAISIKLRSGQISPEDALEVRRDVDLLTQGGIRLAPVSRTAFRLAAELVVDHRYSLRGSDSLHLAGARELGAQQFATLDRTLGENARRVGLDVLAFDTPDR